MDGGGLGQIRKSGNNQEMGKLFFPIFPPFHIFIQKSHFFSTNYISVKEERSFMRM
jgi:hypothetical protein